MTLASALYPPSKYLYFSSKISSSMKYGIFISYSDFDKNKVNLIVNELEGNSMFFPIVISQNREALKPLAQKVADGIHKAEIILPILTKKSITTQWINQEIGFATALKKRIMPVAEANLINKLKGFVHKQIDLPYNYLPNADKAIEQKEFINQIKNLIYDLENDYIKLLPGTVLPNKTEFEKGLEQLDIMKKGQEFQRQRNAFLDSVVGIESAKAEVLILFEHLEEKIEKLKEKQINFGIKKEVFPPSIILNSNGFSFLIGWHQGFNNSNKNSLLFVEFWKGYLTNDSSRLYFPKDKPNMLSDTKYSFDRNKNNENCWLRHNDEKQFTSFQIVDTCLGWLLEQVTKASLE
jgi:hypothetical protein